MKVKGLVLVLPICDWRPLLADQSRLRCFSPHPWGLPRENAFLRGFGAAKRRFRLRLPWQPRDTLYLDCSQAISLPEVLPLDGKHVQVFLRRVYLDGLALVRFEIGYFLSPNHHFPRSAEKLDAYPEAFWNSTVRIRERVTDDLSIPLGKAIPVLAERFARSTTPHPVEKNLRLELVETLTPQIQVVVELDPKAVVSGNSLDREGKTWLRAGRVTVGEDSNRVDVIAIFHRRRVGMEWLRLVRAHTAWIHSQIKLLARLLYHSLESTVEPSTDAYIRELAQNLRAAPDYLDSTHVVTASLISELDDVLSKALHARNCEPETLRSLGGLLEWRQKLAAQITSPAASLDDQIWTDRMRKLTLIQQREVELHNQCKAKYNQSITNLFRLAVVHWFASRVGVPIKLEAKFEGLLGAIDIYWEGNGQSYLIESKCSLTNQLTDTYAVTQLRRGLEAIARHRRYLTPQAAIVTNAEFVDEQVLESADQHNVAVWQAILPWGIKRIWDNPIGMTVTDVRAHPRSRARTLVPA